MDEVVNIDEEEAVNVCHVNAPAPQAPPQRVPPTPIPTVDEHVETIVPPTLRNPICSEPSAIVPAIPTSGPLPRGRSTERRPRKPKVAAEIAAEPKSIQVLITAEGSHRRLDRLVPLRRADRKPDSVPDERKR